MMKSSYKRWIREHWRLVFFVFLLAAAAVIYRKSGLSGQLALGSLSAIRQHILSLGLMGEVIFVGCYLFFVALGLPNLPFQLAAGAIYGMWTAFGMMWLGSNLGAFAAFALARWLGRKSIETLLGSRLHGLNNKIESGGFRFLLVLRLVPLMPFNAINYGAGLSRLKIKDYLGANAIGMLPLTFLHVMFGDGAATLDTSVPLSWLRFKIVFPLLAGSAMFAIATVYSIRHRNKLKVW